MTEFANRMDGITGSAIRELFKLLSNPEIISFGGGNPAKESFPVSDVTKIVNDLLTEKGEAILQYGPTEGYMPLKQAYTEHILRPKGLDANADELLVLSGSSQGLDILAKIFTNPGETILVEAPTFLGALQAFRMYQANIVTVENDSNGINLESLERLMRELKPKLFYCISTFQNPSGGTLPLEKRKKVAELAEKYDVIVIEDDPYCDLRYTGEVLPTIKQFDKSGHVIMLNSFSKILSPGIRVGMAFGNKEIIRKMTIAKQSADTHTSNLSQAIAAEFLSRGLLPKHLERINKFYAERLNTMVNGMKKHFPKECKYTIPEGGLFIWCEMPEGTKMLDIWKEATSKYNVAFIPGKHFYPTAEGHENTFRLNFSMETPERIEAGIEALGKLLQKYVK